MKKAFTLAVCLVLGFGCLVSGTAMAAEWTLQKTATLKGFKAPESVAVDLESGVAYVSNINPVTDDEGTIRYWEDDGDGFISKIDYLKDGGKRGSVEGKWIADKPDARSHGPKGMCLVGNLLFVCDNSWLLMYDVNAPKKAPRVIAIPDAGNLNDVASGDNSVYVSDTAKGKVYKVDREGNVETLDGPESVNGVTYYDGQLYAVSWDNHEIYEMPSLKPFGLADHFTALDSIEVLDDGTFLVTDFKGGKICTVSPDRKTVTTLVETDSPADVGLDRRNGLLFVPSVESHTVEVYKISKQ